MVVVVVVVVVAVAVAVAVASYQIVLRTWHIPVNMYVHDNLFKISCTFQQNPKRAW